MQMGTRRPPTLPDTADHLAARDRISRRDVHPTQMEVAGHESGSVTQIDRVPREIKVRDQRDHPSSRGSHRRTNRACEVGSVVPARDLPVENPTRSEDAPHATWSRRWKRPLQSRGMS